jgi:hypothetical protein
VSLVLLLLAALLASIELGFRFVPGFRYFGAVLGLVYVARFAFRGTANGSGAGTTRP